MVDLPRRPRARPRLQGIRRRLRLRAAAGRARSSDRAARCAGMAGGGRRRRRVGLRRAGGPLLECLRAARGRDPPRHPASDRQLAHRRCVAVGVEGDVGRSDSQHLAHVAQARRDVPGVRVRRERGGVLRRHGPAAAGPCGLATRRGAGGAVGPRERVVGRAGPEHPVRRVAGTAGTLRAALLPAPLRTPRQGGLDSRLVRLPLDAPADLQARGPRVLRDAEDPVERFHPATLRRLLVGRAGRHAPVHLQPIRLRSRPRAAAADPGPHRRRAAQQRHPPPDRAVRRRRPRRRADDRNAPARRRAAARADLLDDAVRHPRSRAGGRAGRAGGQLLPGLARRAVSREAPRHLYDASPPEMVRAP